MSSTDEMRRVFAACTEGADAPSYIIYCGYEEYVNRCLTLGLPILAEADLLRCLLDK